MVSFLLLQAVLWILMTARRNEGRALWLLVPIMLLWVNCHSLFIIGLFCIGFTVGRLLGLARDVQAVLMSLYGLALVVLAAIVVWQCRERHAGADGQRT